MALSLRSVVAGALELKEASTARSMDVEGFMYGLQVVCNQSS
jgi:hypothetical protein